jgi:hypothetical protein
MKYRVASIPGLALLLSSLGTHGSSGQTQAAAADPAESVASTWQHHKTSFTYSGFTSAYTCDGLAERVRQMLELLGARKGVSVTAGACPGGPSTPSHMIIVDVDFYSLAPAVTPAAGAASDASSTVNAQWRPIKFLPHSPGYMGAGDCELLQSMKDFINKNFTLRDLEYRTDCFPNTVSMNAYSVKGQALRYSGP